MTMTLIETKTLSAAAASIEFTSIPQDGTDLLVLLSIREAGGSVASGFILTFNSDTSDYSFVRLRGSGTAVFSDTGTQLLWLNGNTSTSDTFANNNIYIPNYSGSTNKSFSNDGVLENNDTAGYQGLVSGLWSNTDAITTITVSAPDGRNLVVGSTISLYKITKGSDGIVTTS